MLSPALAGAPEVDLRALVREISSTDTVARAIKGTEGLASAAEAAGGAERLAQRVVVKPVGDTGVATVKVVWPREDPKAATAAKLIVEAWFAEAERVTREFIRARAPDLSVPDLREKVEALEAKKAELEKALEEAKVEGGVQARTRLDMARAELGVYRERIAANRLKIADMEAELADLEARLAAAAGSADKEQELRAAIPSRKQELASARASAAAIEQAAKESEATVEALTERIAKSGRLKAELADTRRALADAREATSRAEASGLDTPLRLLSLSAPGAEPPADGRRP
jgi:hypothetical protein